MFFFVFSMNNFGKLTPWWKIWYRLLAKPDENIFRFHRIRGHWALFYWTKKNWRDTILSTNKSGATLIERGWKIHQFFSRANHVSIESNSSTRLRLTENEKEVSYDRDFNRPPSRQQMTQNYPPVQWQTFTDSRHLFPEARNKLGSSKLIKKFDGKLYFEYCQSCDSPFSRVEAADSRRTSILINWPKQIYRNRSIVSKMLFNAYK